MHTTIHVLISVQLRFNVASHTPTSDSTITPFTSSSRTRLAPVLLATLLRSDNGRGRYAHSQRWHLVLVSCTIVVQLPSQPANIVTRWSNGKARSLNFLSAVISEASSRLAAAR